MNRRNFFTGFAGVTAPHEPHKASPGAGLFTNALLRTHENKQVRFYDDRFGIGFTEQERDDLVAFLKAL